MINISKKIEKWQTIGSEREKNLMINEHICLHGVLLVQVRINHREYFIRTYSEIFFCRKIFFIIKCIDLNHIESNDNSCFVINTD